jgi:valyl-tRNA synthetase
LQIIDDYGADALRIALLASTAQGRDVKFGPSRVEGYRNFVTKLWNAARFIQMNEAVLDPTFDPAACREPLNRWIVGETAKTAAAVTGALEAYRFNDAALGLYHFVWDTYCDWYVELAKPLLTGEDAAARAETRAAAAWALAQALHLLHPIAPFVTEELWDKLFGRPGGMLIAAEWPRLGGELIDGGAEAELGWLVRTIGSIRAARTELNVPPGARLTLHQHGAGVETLARLERHREAIVRLARLETIVLEDRAPPPQSLVVVVDEASMALPIGHVIDVGAERKRLQKEIGKLEAEAEKSEQKLANPDFVARAPVEVVEQLRERLEELKATLARLLQALQRIS